MSPGQIIHWHELVDSEQCVAWGFRRVGWSWWRPDNAARYACSKIRTATSASRGQEIYHKLLSTGPQCQACFRSAESGFYSTSCEQVRSKRMDEHKYGRFVPLLIHQV